jgi:maltooligosyltrehalose trehalohydrolase
VVAIQNHDQIGNRAGGERLAALVSPAALRLAAAILLLSPYVPLLFMGEEHGETNPFLYFVSHGDPALVEAVREGRRQEFAAFAWSGDVPDPQAEATFEASRPDWERARRPSHAGHLALYRELLRLRRQEPALRGADFSVRHDEAQSWIALTRRGGGQRLLGLFNFAPASREVPVDAPARLVLSTDDPAYGGAGSTRLEQGRALLAPHAAVLLRLDAA